VTALIDMNNVAFILTWAVDAVMLGAAAIVILRECDRLTRSSPIGVRRRLRG
jgi:hypothetical protein